MASRYLPTDYLYISARIRALEASLISGERLNALLELSAEEIPAALAADGLSAGERTDLESLLDQMLATAFETVEAGLPDRSATLFLRYPNDCNNIKIIEKCRIRGIDPLPLLSPLGRVAPEALIEALEKGETDALPSHMASALPLAREAFAATGSPRDIDLILDRACALDVRDAAAPFPFAARLSAMRSDLINISTLLRITRALRGEEARSLLEAALLPTGTLSPELLLSLFGESETAIAAALARTPYVGLLDEPGISFDALDRRADALLMREIKEAGHTPFGIEVVFAYLLATQQIAKNLRLLVALKKGGKDAQTVRESMRDCYV